MLLNKTQANINTNNIINNNINDEDVEMKIENNNLNIYNIPENLYPQNVDEYFDYICEELLKYEKKYLVDP